MRTIAIINQKGGCGKTTTAINLGAVLAGKGYRTLLVDMDPQSHCALGLSVPENRIQQGTAELLRAGLDGTVGVPDLVWQVSRNLDLVPSTMALATMEQRLSSAPDKDRRLSQVLAPVQDRYDICVVDCPPSIGLLTFNALRACDEVIIPVETGYFALQGSVRQARTIEMLIQRVGHRVRFSVLPTMYDVRTKLAREILGELKRHFGEQVLPLVINFNSKLKEAASFGQPITEYDPSCRGMQDFEELATWLINNAPDPPSMLEPVPGEPAYRESYTPAAHDDDAAEPRPEPVITAAGEHPAMSRAAELAERARALSTRTAALSARLERQDPALTRDEPAQPATALVQVETPKHNEHESRAAELPKADPAPALTPLQRQARLEEKLEQLYGSRVTAQGTLFVQPTGKANNYALAGDFNDWNPSRTPMSRNEALNVWQAVVPLPPGRYRYRLVADGQWVQDPYNPKTETNPFGELNNVIEVGAASA